MLLVDAGGGNGILNQLEEAKINLSDIHSLFITHAHTDHILGVVWVVIMIASLIKSGKYNGTFTVYGHDMDMPHDTASQIHRPYREVSITT